MPASHTHLEFERQKNIKALGITVAVCVLLALLCLISWTIPQPPPPPVDEGIEVNLGNSDQGMGNIAPEVPGEPAKAAETDVAPPKAAASQDVPEESREVADNNENDAPTIRTSPKPETKPKEHAETPKATKPKQEQPVASVAPKPQKPKALYAGGNSTSANSGNGGDSYNGVRNQGIAGGNGDQGKPNGNPTSDSYTGNGGTGKSGVSIRSGLGGRRFTHLPSFTDEFNQNARVAVDITVNGSGVVTNASINLSGTTTTNGNIRSIALAKARQLKLNSSSAPEQTGTIVFDFKLRG